MNEQYRNWEYEKLGEYHRNLDPNWSYTPTYMSKCKHVRAFIESLPKTCRILDLACGEGVFVDEFLKKGWDISGLDYNYESEVVARGDARSLPYKDSSFDSVMFLDAIEHFGFSDQSTVLKEIYRVLKPQGQLMLTAPNLAHFNSRFRLMISGKLDRTDNELDHLGERPASETRNLLYQAGFNIVSETGITFTFPFIYRQIICKHPARFSWLHDALEPFARLFKNLAMVNSFICKKTIYLEGKIPVESRVGILNECPNQELFEINTHMTEWERELLFSLTSGLEREFVAVEIGSHLGASTNFIAEGMRRSGGKVYAVDTWNNTGIKGSESDPWSEFNKNTTPHKTWIVPLRGSSEEIAGSFSEAIDFLFIARDHSYEGVKKDLDNWLPKLKKKAIIVFQEYSRSEGVQRAVSEYILPIQCAAGKKVDSIYWTRVDPGKRVNNSIDVTVAIPTFKRNEWVLDALNSVLDQKTSISYEVLVLDNGSDSALRGKVEEVVANTNISIRYFPIEKIGLHNGRNKALLEGAGEIIVFIDDDIIAPENWLKNLILPFEIDGVTCVGGLTKPRWEGALPEWIEEVDKSFFSLLDLGAESREMKWPETPYGCNMAVRRDWALKVNGFAPDGFGDQFIEWKRGDGETGFAKKIYDYGGKIFYSSEAFLYHRIPPSRLNQSFLYKRSMKGAISSAYSEMRNRRYTKIQLIRKSLVNLYASMRMAVRQSFRAIRGRSTEADKIMIINYFIKSLYLGRLVIDKDLRHWVLKDEYIS